MKKTSLLLLLTVGSSMALAGCGESSVTTITPQNAQTTTTTASTTVTSSDSKTPEITSNGLAPFFQTSDVTYNEAKAVDREDVLAPYKAEMQTINDNNVKKYAPDSPMTDWSAIVSPYRFYDVGTINKAPYKGWKLLLMELDCEGPCFADNIFRFAWDSNARKLVMLEKLSSGEYTPDEMAAISKNADGDFEIKGLTPPKSIVLADGVNTIDLTSRDTDFYAMHDEDYDEKTPETQGYGFVKPSKVAFKDEKLGDLYFDGELLGNVLLKLPDGTVSTYAYDAKMLEEKYYQQIKWTNSSEEPVNIYEEYSLMQHGCGTAGSYFIENVQAADLVAVGKSTAGITLYEAKNRVRLPDSQVANYVVGVKADQAQITLNLAYDSYSQMWQYQGEDKKPLMDFDTVVAQHPVLYWQDPFGRYVAIIKNDFKPSAECGKPVIYLYPQKTSDVSVKVGITEFTKTEPAYGNGWKVSATPEGKIYNYADGKTYPYLFWEGKKDGGMNMTRGAVVAKADIESFLKDSLNKLGLNTNEAKEFNEFWLPKMKAVSTPYVFVSFAGTEEFNKVAPLDIQPKPDTLIRVFMYYAPMNEKVEVAAQKLSAVERKGFTVVEWGGTSSDGWQTK